VPALHEADPGKDNASLGDDMKNNRVKIALLALFCAVIAFELWRLRTAPTSVPQLPSRVAQKSKPGFVLLPASEVTSFARFFAGPKAKIEGWEPTLGDMNDVEANLGQITALSSKYPDTSRHIDDPTQYFRQYGAVIIDGRRVLLVNAICSLRQDKSDTWRRQLILASDGGKCYWRALYDVATQKFTSLAVNGVA
jgi:hypothetical protein